MLGPQRLPGFHHASKGTARGSAARHSSVADSPRGMMATSRVELGLFSKTSRGKGHEMNQDSMLAEKRDRAHIVGVYDGHGDDGHHASKFTRDHISEALKRSSELEKDPEKAMRMAYRAASSDLKKSGINTSASGCTAVTVLRHNGKLVVGNVGDSRAVLGRAVGGRVQAVELTSDQTPSRPDERQRILNAKGKVRPSMAILPGGQLGYVGADRVWDSSEMYGIAMSRSIGDDMVKKSGVIDTPEVSTRKIAPGDKVVIVGSDGIWDCVSSQEAVDIASKHKNPNDAAKALTKLARSRWDQETGGTVSDDISAVVMKIG